MEKIKIFVATYKKFIIPSVLPRENYTIITNGIRLQSPDYDIIVVPKSYKDEIGGYSDVEMSEAYMLKYIYEHQELIEDADYVGLNHYRRYFSFLDKLPHLSDEGNDCVLPIPLKFQNSLREQYANCHNIEDLELFVQCVKDFDAELGADFDKYLGKGTFFMFNMFITKKELFNKMMSDVTNIIDDFLSRRGNIQEYINNNKEKYLKSFKPNNELWYQYRVLGYLYERFSGFYFNRAAKNPLYQKIAITEGKYGRKL